MVEVYYSTQNNVNYYIPVIKVTYTSNLNRSASKLVIDVLKSKLTFEIGSAITLIVNNNKLFYGYIFTTELSDNIVRIIAYDQIRYLLYKDTLSFDAFTASYLVNMICSCRGISLNSCDNSDFILPPKVYNNISYIDMINDSILNTAYSTGNYFAFFDLGGNLYFKNCNSLVIDKSLTLSYNIISYVFIRDINSDTYNYFKIEKENTSKGIKATFIEQSVEAQNNYGTLQYYKKVPYSTTDASIYNTLTILKRKHCKVFHTIKIKCIGDYSFTVGSLVYVRIDKDSISSFYLIQSATHTFEKGYYICDLILTSL